MSGRFFIRWPDMQHIATDTGQHPAPRRCFPCLLHARQSSSGTRQAEESQRAAASCRPVVRKDLCSGSWPPTWPCVSRPHQAPQPRTSFPDNVKSPRGVSGFASSLGCSSTRRPVPIWNCATIAVLLTVELPRLSSSVCCLGHRDTRPEKAGDSKAGCGQGVTRDTPIRSSTAPPFAFLDLRKEDL